MKLIKNKNFKWSKTGIKFAKALIALAIGIGAVKFSGNAYWLAIVPFLHAVENIISHR